MPSVFFDIGLVVVTAAVLALAAQMLRQPPVIAYIAAGLVLGPLAGFVKPSETLEAFSTMGIAFLLFLVGLNLNSRVLKEVGKVSLIAGLGQVLFTTVIGYLLVSSLGFSFVEALYISVALTFSSTIIVVKTLSDKGDLDSLYGKIAIGILLVQDFISIVVLVMITGFQTQASIPYLVGSAAVKAIVLFAVAYVSGRYALPPVLHFIARSQELLFLSGISWMFLFSGLASLLGLSVEVGAFLAGVSMASSPYTYDLGSRIRPLRDFFIVLFFIVLGAQTSLASVSTLIQPAVLLSLFVLIGNPLIVMVLMGALGYRRRTGFLTGLTVAQISEFSLIMMALGAQVGHVSQESVTLVTLVGMATIAGSVYMMINGERLYRAASPYLRIFERKTTAEIGAGMKKNRFDVIVVGCGRMGLTMLSHMESKKDRIAAIDLGPAVVNSVRSKGYTCMYGDVSDTYILEGLRRLQPKLVVSTIPSFDDSTTLLKSFKNAKTKTKVFVTAGNINDAMQLYRTGADFVLMPHFLGGEMASKMVGEFVGGIGPDIKTLKSHHMKYLKNKMARGV